MTAIMVVVGISVAPLTPEVFAAVNLNSSKSNIYGVVVPQDGKEACINQAESQGDKAAVANNEQTAQAADASESAADFNVDQSRSGDFTQGDTETTVDADQSTDCSFEQNQTTDVDTEGPNSGTIETTE
jgi:hypothetical protein